MYRTKIEQLKMWRLSKRRKPLVFIGDLLNIARNITDGPIVITNSDIILDVSMRTRDAIKELTPGTGIIAKRFDVDSLEVRPGVKDKYGCDFFAFHSKDLDKYRDTEFIFGAPWWDHYLPLIMILRGLTVILPSEPIAYHLDHTERWDRDLWVRLGTRFVETMHTELKSRDHSVVAIDEYARQFALDVKGCEGTFKSEIKAQLQRLLIRKKRKKIIHYLHHANATSCRFIDELLMNNDGF